MGESFIGSMRPSQAVVLYLAPRWPKNPALGWDAYLSPCQGTRLLWNVEPGGQGAALEVGLLHGMAKCAHQLDVHALVVYLPSTGSFVKACRACSKSSTLQN